MKTFRKLQRYVQRLGATNSIAELLNSDYYGTSLYLSQLSYFDDEIINKQLSLLKAHRVTIHSHGGCKCFVADFSDLVVVSFRGTIRKPKSTLRQNLKTSFMFWTKKVNDVYMHSGFLQKLEAVEPALLSELAMVPQGKRVLYVGHSLGGALATVLTLKKKPTDLCVFGSPKVALSYNLSDHFDGVNFHRVCTKWDFICLLPPYIPFVLPYKHYGHLKVLDSEFSIKNLLYPHRLDNYLQSLNRQ